MLGVSVEAVWRVQQLLSYVDRRLRDLRVLELVRQRMWFIGTNPISLTVQACIKRQRNKTSGPACPLLNWARSSPALRVANGGRTRGAPGFFGHPVSVYWCPPPFSIRQRRTLPFLLCAPLNTPTFFSEHGGRAKPECLEHADAADTQHAGFRFRGGQQQECACSYQPSNGGGRGVYGSYYPFPAAPPEQREPGVRREPAGGRVDRGHFLPGQRARDFEAGV